jgi:alkanesulfonate monooxygenase SsuD/methylene tetrahydromethanopterin reductase-like flavin-dependent oxidoreductase (luciferase family)
MVSPVTFRHPGNLAKIVATVDEMSGGRAELGLGAGWHEDEHRRHGLAFPDRRTRIEMMEEQLQVIAGLWEGEPGWSFHGRHYQVEDARYGPRPIQQPRPPLIMGTKGVERGLRTAARWADHLNLYTLDPDGAHDAFTRFEAICAEEGRDPAGVTKSVLCGVVVGADRSEADRRREAAARTMEHPSVAEWERASAATWAIGTPDRAAERIRQFEAAGADLIVLQDFLPADLEHVDLLGALAREWSA